MEQIKVSATSAKYATKEEEEKSIKELAEGLLLLRKKKDKTA